MATSASDRLGSRPLRSRRCRSATLIFRSSSPVLSSPRSLRQGVERPHPFRRRSDSRRCRSWSHFFVPFPMRYKLHPDVGVVDSIRSCTDGEPGPTEVVYDDVRDRGRNGPSSHRPHVLLYRRRGHPQLRDFGWCGAQLPPSRQPRSAPAGDRQLPGLPVPAARADPAQGGVQPRELLDKLLRGDPTGITRLHGREEIRTIGPRTLRLYPIFHPAAALYTPRMLETLREDFARLPELLALPEPPQAERAEAEPAVPEPELAASRRPRAGPRAAGAGAEAEPEPDGARAPTSSGCSGAFGGLVGGDRVALGSRHWPPTEVARREALEPEAGESASAIEAALPAGCGLQPVQGERPEGVRRRTGPSPRACSPLPHVHAGVKHIITEKAGTRSCRG